MPIPGDCILNELEEGLGEFATHKLQERGVGFRLRTTAKDITSNKVILSTGERISARTVICTVGNAPHPAITALTLPQDRGRILVDATLQVTGMTNLWALGDAALVPDIAEAGIVLHPPNMPCAKAAIVPTIFSRKPLVAP